MAFVDKLDRRNTPQESETSKRGTWRKPFQMSGWEAGTRTPIRRSRVCPRPFRINKINHLARQNKENSGKIRNTAARKIVMTLGLTHRRISSGELASWSNSWGSVG